MKNLEAPEIWYITGSQHLYGEQTLRQVAAHSQKIVEELNDSQRLPLELVFKPTLTRPQEISALCLEANNAPNPCRLDSVDAHLFAVEDVDWGTLCTEKPVPASAHAV
jgi:L-arabinose isomerase